MIMMSNMTLSPKSKHMQSLPITDVKAFSERIANRSSFDSYSIHNTNVKSIYISVHQTNICDK